MNILDIANREPPKDPFFVGNEISFLHGEHYRVVKILKVEPDRVFVSGMTSQYWIRRKGLERRLDKVPITPNRFF
jgi:hypothetical protein